MLSRIAAALAAGVMGLSGSAALACDPGDPCTYTPASPVYAVSPQGYAVYAEPGERPNHYGETIDRPYGLSPAYGPVSRYRGQACTVCAVPEPVVQAPVAAEEITSLSDSFFYGGLSGGAGPGFDVGSGGGGGGNFGDTFNGFAEAQSVSSALGSAYANASAYAQANAKAKASAYAMASAYASSSSSSLSRGWRPTMGPHPRPMHGCGCGGHYR